MIRTGILQQQRVQDKEQKRQRKGIVSNYLKPGNYTHPETFLLKSILSIGGFMTNVIMYKAK